MIFIHSKKFKHVTHPFFGIFTIYSNRSRMD